MSNYGEEQIATVALALLAQSPAGLSTSELIKLVTVALSPDGHDAEILANRRDTHFSQKVRNLVSHRKLVRRGYTTYDSSRHAQKITALGRRHLQDERVRVEPTVPRTRRRVERAGVQFGSYRRANEGPRRAPSRPFAIDPNKVDRATGAHAVVQNALATWVVGRQLEPLSHAGGVAEFDLAWFDGSRLYVAEVKSLTLANETSQLRLGLGQVLHYQALLKKTVPQVRAVLAVERAPTEPEWLSLCKRHGVLLAWPATFDEIRSGQ